MKKLIISMILLLPLFFAGCSSQQNNEDINQDEGIKIDTECQTEVNNLETICKEENISNLDIKTLYLCTWIEDDKDDYLQNCNSYINIHMFLLKFNKENESKFLKQLINLCNSTKFGELTAKEITICSNVSNNFDFLTPECDY